LKIISLKFLAPKSYCYTTKDDKEVIKYKGPAKDKINWEWFESQYAQRMLNQLVLKLSRLSTDSK